MLNRSASQKTILVIDDDLDILAFLHDLLELEGYQVVVTPKGDHLEKMQQEGLPDLILLDIFLSGRDGREIVKDLKEQEKTQQIPVIMFSAHPSAEATARAAGADDFLAKPFPVDDLLAKVHALLL
jgi:DNA-binding response OmpR family regulator